MPYPVETKIPFKIAYLMKIDQKENLCNTMITSFMASAKQLAWRKKFARMSKAGEFRKGKNSVDEIQKRRARNTGKAGTLEARENLKNIKKKWDIEEQTKLALRYTAKSKAIQKQRLRRMSQDQKTAEIEKDVREHMGWLEAKQKYGYGTVDLLHFYFAVPYRMGKQLGLPKTPPKYGRNPA